jgi:hypothetical protein
MKTQKHTYKPLPRELTIMPSPIHGLGLFARPDLDREIPVLISSQLIGVSHISSNIFKQDEFILQVMNVDGPFNGSDYKVTRDELFLNGLIRTPLGGWINHSDDANLDFKYLGDGLWGVVANKDIYPGDELTLNYNFTPCGVIKE